MGALDVLEDFYTADPSAFDGAGINVNVEARDSEDMPPVVRNMLEEKGAAGNARWPRFHDLVAGKPVRGLDDPEDESTRDFHIGLEVARWLHGRKVALNGSGERVLALEAEEDAGELVQIIADAMSYCRAQREDVKGKANDLRYLSRTAARVIQCAREKLKVAKRSDESSGARSGRADYQGNRGSSTEVHFEPLSRVELKALPSFPTWALGSVGRFVDALSANTQTPPDMAGVCALGTLGAAVARKAQVRTRWTEELALYLLCVAGPGSRKSEVWKRASEPIRAHEAAQVASTSGQAAENRQRVALLEKRLQSTERAYAKAEDEAERRSLESDAISLRHVLEAARRAPQHSPRLMAGDITPERLAVLVAQNEERMMLSSAEGGQIFDRLFRYSQHAEPNMELILSGHTGERCSIDRQGGEPIILHRPVLTILGTVQPYVLETLSRTPAFEGRGLLARFAYVFPPDFRGYRDVRAGVELDGARVQEFERTVGRLLAIPHNVERPVVLGMEEPALEVFYDFADRMERSQADGGYFEDLKGWASKAAGLAMRLAGVLALAERPTATSVSKSVVERAVALGDYFAAHSARAFEMMSGRTGDAAMDKVWRWITNRSEPGADFSRSDLWDGVKGGRFGIAADLDAPLRRLAACGRIARRPSDEPANGRPAEVWAVNPAALAREN
jgi:hypothetical protein